LLQPSAQATFVIVKARCLVRNTAFLVAVSAAHVLLYRLIKAAPLDYGGADATRQIHRDTERTADRSRIRSVALAIAASVIPALATSTTGSRQRTWPDSKTRASRHFPHRRTGGRREPGRPAHRRSGRLGQTAFGNSPIFSWAERGRSLRCRASSTSRLEFGQHRYTASSAAMTSASDRQPGVTIGHETPVETGTRSRVDRCTLPSVHVAPRGSLRSCSSIAVRKIMRAVRPATEAHQFVNGPRTALGVDHEPDIDREVRRSGEDRLIAADLLREHLASLGA